MPEQTGASIGSTGYGDPYRRLPPPGKCRIKINPAQLAFHWAGSSAVAESPESKAPLPLTDGSSAVTTLTPAAPSSPALPVTATSSHLGSGSPALLKVKRPFKEVVERFLREKGVPYIAVDEAKKALFGSAKLRSFHFVVYQTTGKNWLLHTAQVRKEVRECLREWEAVFGEGFMGVVAKRKSDGTIKFQTLAGDTVEIQVPS